MSAIYIANAAGESQAYDEDQVQSLWSSGQLTAGTLFWKEGMAEWLPLSHLFPAAVVNAPPLPVATSAGYEVTGGAPYQDPFAIRYFFVKNPAFLTRLLMALLGMEILASILTMLGDAAQLSLLGRTFTEAEAEANDARQQTMGLVTIGVHLITSVVFLMWTYRACKNSHGFRASNMEFTPGWAVGCYFVPLLNLVKPFQAMREIWQISVDPQRWHRLETPVLLRFWWGFWLLSWIMGYLILQLSMRAKTVSDLQLSTMGSLILGVVEIISAILAILVIHQIYRQQKRLTE